LKELKANLVNQAITTLSDCEELQEKWMSCFSLKTIDEKKVGIKILSNFNWRITKELILQNLTLKMQEIAFAGLQISI
jgi:hypothetical protein